MGRRTCGQPGVGHVFANISSFWKIFNFIKIFLFWKILDVKTINHFFAGKIINEWDSIGKKKLPQVKVNKLWGAELS